MNRFIRFDRFVRIGSIVSCATLLSASMLHAATLYVDPTGSDADTGTTRSNAWQTITYALKQAKPGDTISLNDGTYEVEELAVPAGVSLTGTRRSAQRVTLKAKPGQKRMLALMSAKNTDGHQTLSHLTLDGKSARLGIEVKNRNGVTITRCHIRNTTEHGVLAYSSFMFGGYQDKPFLCDGWWNYWPPGDLTDAAFAAVWPKNPITNFELSHCRIADCAYWSGQPETYPHGSSVRLYHLKDSACHHNEISTANHSFCMHSCCGFWESVAVHDNMLICGGFMGWRSDYPLEVWMTRHCRIYRNTANASFSIVQGKDTDVFDNRILSPDTRGMGIEFTGQSEAKVYGNWVEGTDYGITVGTAHSRFNTRNIEVFGNIVHNAGGNAIRVHGSGRKRKDGIRAHTTNVNVHHNTLVGNVRGWPMIHLYMDGPVDMFDVRIQNNIIYGGLGLAGWTERRAPGATVRAVIENNIIFGNKDNGWRDGAPRGTIAADPMFVNLEQDDFALRPGSPAIDAAVPVGLRLPRAGRALDIGAVEFWGE
ncbi:MAG: DUF1565 domain-containing protein [Kiritimatiellae bacterium]|nr:DUF1565 domain-containing protein [Kiritimatiellia bacterium]